VVAYAEAKIAGTITSPVFWILATLFGVIGFAGPTLAGLPAALRSPAIRRLTSTWLALSLLVASFVPFLLFTHKGGSQNFFVYYGICAACILSAQGLVVMWDRAQPLTRRELTLGALGFVAWLVVLVAAAVLPNTLSSHPSIGPAYALWIGLPVLVAVGLGLVAVRSRRRRAAWALAAVSSVIAVGLLDTPLHTGSYIVPRVRDGRTLYSRDSPQLRGLTPGLQAALTWIRTHTPTNAVIAVNNVYSNAAQTSPDYYYYSAFGERRSFLEGWEDTIAAADETNPQLTPFPGRYWLNTAVFGAGNTSALAVMRRRYGVRYLFVDHVHGSAAPGIARLGRVVFANPSATVYQVG
jgi:hypothetical protein